MKNIPLLAAVAIGITGICRADDAALQKINAGAGEIILGESVPGVLTVEDPAFILLEDSNAKAVVAASTIGKGKVIAFTHGSFLRGNFVEQESYVAFMKNAIAWATDDKENPVIGVAPDCRRMVEALKKMNFEASMVAPDQVGVVPMDLYFLSGQSDKALPADGIKNIKDHLAKGGAVFTAATPWPFGKTFPDFSKFPPNQILAAFGIQYLSTGYVSGKRPLIITSGADDSPILAANQLKTVEPTDELINALRRGVFLKGEKMDEFLVVLKSLNETVGPVIPTKKTPIIPENKTLHGAIVDIETALNLKLPAGKMYAIPASADYPGAVSDDASMVIHSIEMDVKHRGWASQRNFAGWNKKEMRPTGIYARPGDLIDVIVPDALVGKGFEVVIGTYDGGLSGRKKWERYPKLQRSFPIKSEKTLASNGLGGLVTIRVPQDTDFDEKQSVIITGGVRAPLYVHGETSLKDWKETIRHAPAPWAELVSDRMIVTVPSDHIRDLEDPDKVMEAWIAYIEKSAELAQLDRDEFRAERIYFDRQTAAGHMHSGYPVAAHIGRDSKQAVDSKSLMEKGSWGFFHEYGHNHQHDLWMLPGTIETTCNLWSVYLFEELIGKKRETAHGSMNLLTRRTRIGNYFRNGADFSKWNVWTALDTYLLIQEEFGWEPFQKTFAVYNNMPEKEWPRTQQQKNDRFVIELSKACGKNLAPYWRKWNLPMTKNVDEELSDLEVWECTALKTIIDQ